MIFRAAKYFLPVFFFFFSVNLNAQHEWGNGANGSNGSGGAVGSLKGVVVNSVTSEPLEYAYLVLHKVIDSALVTGGITDTAGRFKLDKVPFGKYYIAITLIGHKPQKISNVFIGPKNPDKVLDTIRLDQSTSTLNVVEIKDKKQDIEYTLDKKIVNVEKSLVSTGGTAIDVMQTIPSVTVDIDGNMSMRGSSNITVLIDGKPSGLTGLSRSALLEQIPASSIASIEIISNPSAKYDPDGMTGIINIVLKKKKEKGYNGIFSVNAGTGDKYNGSIGINYSKNIFNLFANYDGRINNSKSRSDMNRTTILNDTLSYREMHSESNRQRFSNNFKLGADLDLNAKNTITISGIYGFGNSSDSESDKNTDRDFNEFISSYYQSANSDKSNENSMDYMLNYRKTFDKKGELLTADAVYTVSDESESSDQNIQYYMPNDFSSPYGYPLQQKTTTDDASNVATFQTDYSYPFSKNSRLEAGAKSIIRSMDNDYKFLNYSEITGQWADDSLLSNRFLYDEQIHAIYSTYSNTIGIFEFQAGLRAEQAITKSTQVTMDTVYKKDYFSIFPTLHLNLNMKNDNSIQLSYSRRVSRPSYWSLNPFVDASTPGVRHFGNPYLMPEYTDSYELGHMKYWENTSLNSSVFYKQINDAIQRYMYIDNQGVQNVTSMNISSGVSYGLEFIFSQTFSKLWKINATFSYFRTIMKGSESGSELTNSNYSWTTKLNSTMTIFKNLDIQVTANYRAPMVQLQGTTKQMFTADIAMKKDIWKKKASISLRCSDVFNTQQFNMERSGTNFTMNMNRKRESRVLYLGFTYKINGGVKAKSQKKSYEGTDDGEGNDL